MKYIMFETVSKNGTFHEKMPVIFPNDLIHSDVAAAMVAAFAGIGRTCKPISAGSCSFKDTRVGGSSETLNLKSRLIDENLIQLSDYRISLSCPND